MRKKTTYLFIDDTKDILNLFENLNENPDINIKTNLVDKNATWSDLIHKLKDDNSFDGLLLDWKLSGETEIDFDSEALAQQARKFDEKDFPIVLCSSMPTDNFFKRDSTAKDLFDIVYQKEQLQDNIKALISLAEGYIQLKEIKNRLNITTNTQSIIAEILGTKKKIDTRAVDELITLLNPEKAVHEFAQFFLRQILEPNGLLINEYTLAARLTVSHGLSENANIIDPESHAAWCELKKQLTSIKYSGIFSDVYDRWWADDLVDWFKKEIYADTSPKNIPFQQRFEMLKNKFDIANLKSAALQKFAKEPFLWEACAYNKRAIDTDDALLVGEKNNLYPWQDSDYVCLEAAIERRKPIHPLYESKFKMLRAKYSGK